MILTCPQCATRYRVEGLNAGPTEVRCAKCVHVWLYDPRSAAGVQVAGPAHGRVRGRKATPLEPAPARRDVTPARTVPPRPRARPLVVIPTSILVVFAAAFAWGVTRDKTAGPQVEAPASQGSGTLSPEGAINIVDLRYDRTLRGGIPMLSVQGSLVNSASRAKAVGALEAVLSDAAGRPVDRWVFAPARRSLAPGEKIGFVTTRLRPPDTAQNLALHLWQR